MEKLNQSTKQFKTLRSIHTSICISVSLFLMVTLVLNWRNPNTVIHAGVKDDDEPILYVAIAFAIVAPFMGKYVYKKYLRGLDFSSPTIQKFSQYMSAWLIRYTILTFVGLFNVAVWFLTSNLIALVFGALIIAYMSMLRPVKNKAIATLKISKQESWVK